MRQQDKKVAFSSFSLKKFCLRKASYKNFCFLKASNSVSDIASQSALV